MWKPGNYETLAKEFCYISHSPTSTYLKNPYIEIDTQENDEKIRYIIWHNIVRLYQKKDYCQYCQ